jgi:hypothetical protein
VDKEDWKNLAGDPQYTSLKADLAKWIPQSAAPAKPDRNEFDFDFATYTYKRK